MKPLSELLNASAALHQHLCPRQVLGVRMGVLAGKVLGLELPQRNKRLLTIMETDGCACDGISVATNCWVGRRTLRVEDYGKVAATFVDTLTGQSIRVVPRADARQRAYGYASEARNRWEAQLLGYQRCPDEFLLDWQEVTLRVTFQTLLSRPGARVTCQRCGEEIINEREVVRDGIALCQACAGQAYYQLANYPLALSLLPSQRLRYHGANWG